MIQRAVTSIIGVVIGLFATFAVFSAILGGLDGFYLLTQDACNYGSENSPKRTLRIAPEVQGNPRDADAIDWTASGLDVYDNGGICAVDGANASETYLTPTGDEFILSGDSVQFSRVSASDFTAPVTGTATAAFADATNLYVTEDTSTAEVLIIDRAANTVTRTIDVPSSDAPRGIWSDGTHVYVANASNNNVYAYAVADGTHNTTLSIASSVGGANGWILGGIWSDGTNMLLVDRDSTPLRIVQVNLSSRSLTTDGDPFISKATLTAAGNTDPGDIWSDGSTLWVLDETDDHIYAYDMTTRQRKPSSEFRNFASANSDPRAFYGLNGTFHVVDASDTVYAYSYAAVTGSGSTYPWLPAENVFVAQRQLVTLLAVIAAIGMPIGAMTAIVFFGQAVISAGVSGQGASQVIVAIGAVVVILVAVQMFQQFAGYLGDAFDAVNGDRFVVFDETLGSLAETIAEFWGVLAFAGLINIATIVWRNYSGNFSIGGSQGGL